MIQSPSSILTYKQCPRKYYYQYIISLRKKPNVHQVIGGTLHSVLQNFFCLDISDIGNHKDALERHILNLFKVHWESKRKELENFNLTEDEKRYYYNESVLMLINWLGMFLRYLETEMKKGFSFNEAFKRLTPQREIEIISQRFMVRGFIDAIESRDGRIRLMDYKTSKSFLMDEAQRLQLAIYALLYREQHGVPPNEVGIYFLKHEEQVMKVDEDLLNEAVSEINNVHEKTKSRDVKDYPKKESGLCRWNSGTCDFYDTCIMQKELI